VFRKILGLIPLLERALDASLPLPLPPLSYLRPALVACSTTPRPHPPILLPSLSPSLLPSLQFKPFSGSFLMKGYHPLAGGLLDDSSPLTWTKVFVYLKEPNLLVISQSNIDREEEVREGGREGGRETCL